MWTQSLHIKRAPAVQVIDVVTTASTVPGSAVSLDCSLPDSGPSKATQVGLLHSVQPNQTCELICDRPMSPLVPVRAEDVDW